MTKNDKTYRIVSICNFLLHICLFVFVMIAGFLPFNEKQNFYECFTGFFGKTLSTLQPYLVMAIFLLSCVGTFLAIKRPQFSLLTVAGSVAFFVIVTLPYYIEAMIIGFASPWIGGSMSEYGMGFSLMVAASNIFYLDVAFLVYSILVLIRRTKRKR